MSGGPDRSARTGRLRRTLGLARLVEAAYGSARDDHEWLEGVLHAAKPFLDHGLGVFGVFYDIRDAAKPVMRSPTFLGAPAGSRDAFDAMVRNAPEGLFASMLRRVPSCATLSDRLAAIGADIRQQPLTEHVLAPLGVRDFLSLAATEASGHGCLVGAPLPEVTSAQSLDPDLWTAIAAHVTAGMRLRHLPARDDAPDALPVWAALVAGRWTVVDAFDRSGERVLVAKRTHDTPAPSRAAPTPLTAREHEVVARAAMGQSNKLIAYELGIAPSTVAGHLTKAAAKLGVETRIELITAFARQR